MLTPKQKRFCKEYVIDLNGTQAAIRAGYSKKTARQTASEYLAKPNIQEFVKKLQDKIQQRTEITADMVVNELAKIGFSNIQDLIESGNATKDLSGIAKEKAASVSSIKVTTTTGGGKDNEWIKEAVEFRLYDKVSALEKLGKHLGIFEKDNVQQSTKISVKLNK